MIRCHRADTLPLPLWPRACARESGQARWTTPLLCTGAKPSSPSHTHTPASSPPQQRPVWRRGCRNRTLTKTRSPRQAVGGRSEPRTHPCSPPTAPTSTGRWWRCSVRCVAAQGREGGGVHSQPHTPKSTNAHAHIHTYIHNTHPYIHTHTYIFVYTHTPKSAPTRTHTSILTYTHISVFVYTGTHKRTNAHKPLLLPPPPLPPGAGSSRSAGGGRVRDVACDARVPRRAVHSPRGIVSKSGQFELALGQHPSPRPPGGTPPLVRRRPDRASRLPHFLTSLARAQAPGRGPDHRGGGVRRPHDAQHAWTMHARGVEGAGRAHCVRAVRGVACHVPRTERARENGSSRGTVRGGRVRAEDPRRSRSRPRSGLRGHTTATCRRAHRSYRAQRIGGRGAAGRVDRASALCRVRCRGPVLHGARMGGWKGYAKAQSQPRLFAAAQVPELTSADSLWSPGDRALLMGRLWAAHAARGAEAALLDQAVQLRRAMAAPSEHAASTRHAPPPRPRAGRLASRLSADATEPSGADRVAAAAEKTMPSSFLDVRAARSGAEGTGLWRIALRQPASDRAEERSKQAEVRAGICGGRSCCM